VNPQLIIAVLCVLSGLLMLDKYSVGEFGVSQPLVELPIGRKVPLDAQAAGISGAVAFFTMRILANPVEQITHRRRLLFLHIAALDIAFLHGVLLALLAAGTGIVILPLFKFLSLIPLERLLAATLSVGLASGLVLFGIKKRLAPFFVGFAAWVVVWAPVRF